MKKRYILKNKLRFALFIIATLILVFTAFFASSAYSYKPPEYGTVTVYNGDTLWNIASKYNAQGDIREFIYEIKTLNNLTSSEIFTGTELKIPLY